MKLRPRNKPPTNGSSTILATASVLPPDITRLQTPPISELSNAGSTTVRKERLSDSSSSVVDDSDMEEERMESLSPTTKGRRLKITVPAAAAAPLTKNNLEKLSEEITSAVEIGSKEFFSSPMPSPHTRLVQARNFLRAENRNFCLGFATMLEQIDDFLHEIPEDVRRVDEGIYREVKDLLRTHRIRIRAGEERRPAPPPRRKRPGTLEKRVSRPSKQDDRDIDIYKNLTDQAEEEDPFEYTNRFNSLVRAIRRDPSAQRPSAVMSHLRDLARPLNRSRALPSAEEARRLITERMREEEEGGWRRRNDYKVLEKEKTMKEDRDVDDVDGEDDMEDIWSGFDDDAFPPPDEETEPETEYEEEDYSSIEYAHAAVRHHGASNTNLELEREPVNVDAKTSTPRLGQGSMMPREVREWDWERDRRVVLNGDYEEGEGAQLLLAETPFLQMLMGGQIRGDLEGETTNRKGSVESVTEKEKEKKGRVIGVGMPYKFSLPRPSRERMEEANDIAKALNIQPDPQKAKRKRNWAGEMESRSEDEDEGGVRGRGKGKGKGKGQGAGEMETEGEELGSEREEVYDC